MDLKFFDAVHVNEQKQIVLGRSEQDLAAIADISHTVEVYHSVLKENRFLAHEFQTLEEYLFYLRAIAMALNPVESNAMFYFAAAVSDFYVCCPL
jgi:hypothetical protein